MNRCTGHTSRMLREAIILAMLGKTVRVVSATQQLADDMSIKTGGIMRRLRVPDGVGRKISFHGLRTFAENQERWVKQGDIVMGDPGIADSLRTPAERARPLPEEWST